MQAIVRSSSNEDDMSNYVNESLKSMQSTFSELVGFAVKKHDESNSKIKRYKEVEFQLKQDLEVLKSKCDEVNMVPDMVSTSTQVSSNTVSAAVQATSVHIAKGTSTLNDAYLKQGISTQTRIQSFQNVCTNTETSPVVTMVNVETETSTCELVDAFTQGNMVKPLRENKCIGLQTMLMSTAQTASVGTATILETKSSIQLQTDDKDVLHWNPMGRRTELQEYRSFNDTFEVGQYLHLNFYPIIGR